MNEYIRDFAWDEKKFTAKRSPLDEILKKFIEKITKLD